MNEKLVNLNTNGKSQIWDKFNLTSTYGKINKLKGGIK